MEQDKLKQDLVRYQTNKTKLTATIDSEDIIFTVLFAGEEGAYVNIQGKGETQLDYLGLSHSRLREYSRASEFVEQEVLTSTLEAWQGQGKEFEMDTVEDIDVGWLIRQVKEGKISWLKMEN